MADFLTAYRLVRQVEGGYQDNPNDRGNYACGDLIGTNKGIAAPTLQDWISRCPTVEDMKSLTSETAQTIYKYYFWDRIRGDSYHNQSIATMLFDTYVNQTGYFTTIVPNAIKKQVSGFGNYMSLPPSDYVIDTINNLNANKLFHDLKDEREYWYRYQAEKPGQSVFLNGWLNRLNYLTFVEVYSKPVTYTLVALVLIAGFSYLMWMNRKQIKV